MGVLLGTVGAAVALAVDAEVTEEDAPAILSAIRRPIHSLCDAENSLSARGSSTIPEERESRGYRLGSNNNSQRHPKREREREQRLPTRWQQRQSRGYRLGGNNNIQRERESKGYTVRDTRRERERAKATD